MPEKIKNNSLWKVLFRVKQNFCILNKLTTKFRLTYVLSKIMHSFSEGLICKESSFSKNYKIIRNVVMF